MIENENNMVYFIGKFKDQGYTDSYTIEDGQLISTISGEVYNEEDFTIDAACKFDITNNGIDEQHLFSISTKNGKGIYIDLFGNSLFDYYGLLERKFKGVETQKHIVEEDHKLKYGLPKIYKDEFEINPERFELRIGFPDFPTCPFDNTFSMLGYDKANKEYVWLVTSIIKDQRLQTNHYKK